MYIYYGLFLWIALSSFTKSRYIQLITVFILILVVGLRFKVGGDWYSYLMMYEQISNTSLLFSLNYTDPAYGIINYLAYEWKQDIWLVNLICAIIFFLGIDRLCNFSKNYWIAFLISFPYLIITVSMGYTRQSAAIGLAFIAFVSLLKNRKINFFLSIFLGLLFHKSAILMLIFAPYVFNYNFTHLKNMVYIFISITALYFLMNRFGSEDNIYFSNEVSSAGALSRMLIHLPSIILYITYRKKFAKIFENKIAIFDTLVALIAVFFLIALFYSTFADRFNLYFYIFDMFILSTFSLFLNHQSYYIYIFIIAFFQFILFSIWLNFSPFADCCWIPYQNYLLKN